jgi:hypothetical protein
LCASCLGGKTIVDLFRENLVVKKLKILLALVVAAIIAIQFIRPSKNISAEISDKHISKPFSRPHDVQMIFENACFDCHSNNTRYPWYANVQPVAWFIRHDVEEGTKHLNFSEFGAGRLRRQFHKLEEIEEQMSAKEMPPIAYQWMHDEAKLTDVQRTRLIEWSNAAREDMKARYPIDSLMRRK